MKELIFLGSFLVIFNFYIISELAVLLFNRKREFKPNENGVLRLWLIAVQCMGFDLIMSVAPHLKYKMYQKGYIVIMVIYWVWRGIVNAGNITNKR